ncbi:hypothetical protein FPCIR_13419 [Fusarium pseudocircinatum]|uniref:DUF7580 domain-containing protein n=1 Tax=Fusarium pseudocircinatum TaxID=56676 RepID=A0A8H5NR17_9HYPO|nr:hypothetical protein FPCIR_13419 [Fusarium pseudocircinatum]
MGGQGLAIFRRGRRYENELRRLVNKFENERVRLEEVCERVLIDLVPHSQIEGLIQNPGRLLNDDPELQTKLRRRLWKSYDIFDRTLQEIKAASDEATERINVQVQDRSNLRKSLRHSFLDDLLSRINEGVSVLEQIVDRSLQLEPARKIRFQGKFLCYIRGLAAELFTALQASFECPCHHYLGLQLEKRTLDAVPDDTMPGGLTGRAEFRLSLSYKGPGMSSTSSSSHNTKWSDVLVMPTCVPRPQTSAQLSRPKSEKGSKYPGLIRRSLFKRLSSSAAVDSPQPPDSPLELETVAREERITGTRTLNLCEAIRQPHSQAEDTYSGLIFSTSLTKRQAYDVYPIMLSTYRESCNKAMTSLNEVLDQNQRCMILSETDRLRLAVVIASDLLQLHGSPWMPAVIRSQDIYLIQGLDNPICERFFTLQTLPIASGSKDSEDVALTSMRNQPLFYLGVLLIELAFGKSLELLRSERDRSSTGSRFFTDYRTAKRLVDQVKSFIGPNYGSAVSRCIDEEFHGRGVGLEDQDLSHDVYAGVVALLEKELEG